MHLNLWVFAALSAMGLIRCELAWPDSYRWALIPLGAAVAGLAAATRLPWNRLAASRWTMPVLAVNYASAIGCLFLYCLVDPDAEIMFPTGAMVITVAAASTTGARASLAIGAVALAGYLTLAAVRPMANMTLGLSVVAVMAVVIGLCARTAHNRRLQQAQRDAAERRAAALLENGSDAVLAIAGDRVQYVSASVHRILGHGNANLSVEDLAAMTHPDELDLVREWVAKLSAGGPGHTVRLESRTKHADGHYIDTEVTGTNHLDDPDIGAIILTIRDVSTQKALRSELTRQAFEDPVTGLPNRSLLRDRAETAVRRHLREAGRVSLLLVDLDDFKKVNDTLGHMAGDDFLRAVARHMAEVVRPSDTLARLGGDEFAVLVEGLDDMELHAMAQRLLEAVKLPVRIGNTELVGSASVGIATVKAGEVGDGDAAEELLRDADLAMYAAKATGRDRVAVFEESMYADAVAEAETRAELERAVENDEFVVNYQPIVDLPSGRLIGVEALVRWQHPTRGLLGPNEFIAHTERTGLIVPIGARVLRVACSQVAAWHREIPAADRIRVSINLSARQFQEPGLLDTVREVLHDTGIAPERVVLEITESLLMHDVDATVVTLNELRAMGVRIAIDDFGTGYSSLSYLRRFPIDILKIDKAFIDGITANAEDATLAEAVVGLGRALRLQTVAEGIEHADQKSILSDLGCTYGQGYLFARPGTADEITVMVREAYE
ncbi:putative bifunctional diguanylate cyclase/phosphodiesterase [Paractinoplanes rishiriensis]|uniref:putative bifunctional diguanylate cyclase/phosphodiesterase n=1 Tax=Paractinoplanes rishiriensis TaxID=1050105 RepID=UPI001942A094|nr:EAL domain-containing protein [Actinoplanes rishiriensis]